MEVRLIVRGVFTHNHRRNNIEDNKWNMSICISINVEVALRNHMNEGLERTDMTSAYCFVTNS
jgi:hypothetical protein